MDLSAVGSRQHRGSPGGEDPGDDDPDDDPDDEIDPFADGVVWGSSAEDTISFIESVAMNSKDNWGKESENDTWCFLCSRSDKGHKLKQNQYWKDLMSMFENKTNMTRFNMCKAIQGLYKREFYNYQNPQQEWTLRSIRMHAEEHGGMPPETMLKDLARTFFTTIQNLAENGLKARDTNTGAEWITKSGSEMLCKLTMCLLRVHAVSAGR
jgi:hypothetical protein